MLVTFESKYGRITMPGTIAEPLLHMMGHSGTIPSALLAKDIPNALKALQEALGRMEEPKMPEEDPATDSPAPISLKTRAFPLIQLMENAIANQADIIWEASNSNAPLKF